MTQYLTVRLTPWATDRILRDYCKGKRVTKTALRQSLREFPDTEFHTVGGPGERAGAVLTTREAKDSGVDVLEVRFIEDRDLAMVTIDPSGAVIVS